MAPSRSVLRRPDRATLQLVEVLSQDAVSAHEPSAMNITQMKARRTSNESDARQRVCMVSSGMYAGRKVVVKSFTHSGAPLVAW